MGKDQVSGRKNWKLQRSKKEREIKRVVERWEIKGK
jgi:hypothetical protein